jgi:hypothetical protein
VIFQIRFSKQTAFISVGFYALVDFEDVNLVMDDISDAEWKAIDELPFMMDHVDFEKKRYLRYSWIAKPGTSFYCQRIYDAELQSCIENLLR